MIALVTGSAKRIGKDIAVSLAKNGYLVLIHYNHSLKEVKSTVNEINAIYDKNAISFQSVCFQANLARPEEITAMMRSIQDSYEYLDILINNASTFYSNAFRDISDDEWDEVMNVNLRAPFLLSQYSQVLKIKDIINISDLLAINHHPLFIHHGVSKAALISLTQKLAKELAPQTRVNCIVPGLILKPESLDTKRWREMINSTPLALDAGSDPIIQSVHYILDNPLLNGEILHVDGGASL